MSFRYIFPSLTTLVSCSTAQLLGASFTPGNISDLNSDIQTANFNVDASNTISFPITGISGMLISPVGLNKTYDSIGSATKTYIIDGANSTYSGGAVVRAFFLGGGTTTVMNLNFKNFTAQGSTGGFGATQGFGGGSGAGLGGGVFVGNGAIVTLQNCTFESCTAQGAVVGPPPMNNTGFGSGGGGGGGGGGSTMGTGGNGVFASEIGGGGGGGGFFGNGGSSLIIGIEGGGGGGGGGFTGNGGSYGDNHSSSGEGGFFGYGGGSGGGNQSGGGGGASFSNNGGNPTHVPPDYLGGAGGVTPGFPSGGAGGSNLFSRAESGGGGSGTGVASNGQNGQPNIKGGDGGSATIGGFGGGGGGTGTDTNEPGGRGGNAFATGNGGGGGGGGGGIPGGNGGNGSNFGGGGAGGAKSASPAGGNGGFAGGGGGGENTGSGGNGGFGAGGGSGISPGIGGYGAGNGSSTMGADGGNSAGFGGAIFIQQGGNLTFLDSVSFTASSVAAGTGGSNSALEDGIDIFMMSGSFLTFDISTDVPLQNPIAGNQGRISFGNTSPTNVGGLTKQGPAVLTLVGDNTYTGTTSIQAGELRLNGTVISNIVVSNGGILSGNGSINTDITGNGGNLINHGLLSPGVGSQGFGSVGQIHVTNMYTNEAIGVFRVDITPTGSVNDKVFVIGNAQLNGGELQVIVNAGNYIAGTEYPIIVGTVNGAFANQANPTQLGVNAGQIQLEVFYGSLILKIIENHIFMNQTIDPGIPTQVANCILANPIPPNTDFSMVVEVLGTLSNQEVNEALISLSAVRYGSLEWVNARNNSLVADILSEHLFKLCQTKECSKNVWIAPFGNFIDQKKTVDNLPKYRAEAGGIAGGVDVYCDRHSRCGLALGYTHTLLTWKPSAGKGNINSYYGALYGSWNPHRSLTIDASVLGGESHNDTNRKVEFSIVDRDAEGSFWNYFITGHLACVGNQKWKRHSFEPFVLADYHYYHHGTFTESGADSIDLKVYTRRQNMMRGEAGLVWKYSMNLMPYSYTPYVGLSWIGEFPLNTSKQPASFIGQSCVIHATAYSSSVQLASPQAGVEWTFCHGPTFLLGYKGLYNSTTQINEVEARLDWSF